MSVVRRGPGRPRVLQFPVIVTFKIEHETYILLKEIAYRKNMSVSALIREIINEYLERHGLKEAKVTATDCGINELKMIDEQVTLLEIRELNEQLKKCIESMCNSIPKSQAWLEAKYTAIKIIRKLNALIQKYGKVGNKVVYEAIRNIHKFEELTTPEK